MNRFLTTLILAGMMPLAWTASLWGADASQRHLDQIDHRLKEQAQQPHVLDMMRSIREEYSGANQAEVRAFERQMAYQVDKQLANEVLGVSKGIVFGGRAGTVGGVMTAIEIGSWARDCIRVGTGRASPETLANHSLLAYHVLAWKMLRGPENLPFESRSVSFQNFTRDPFSTHMTSGSATLTRTFQSRELGVIGNYGYAPGKDARIQQWSFRGSSIETSHHGTSVDSQWQHQQMANRSLDVSQRSTKLTWEAMRNDMQQKGYTIPALNNSWSAANRININSGNRQPGGSGFNSGSGGFQGFGGGFGGGGFRGSSSPTRISPPAPIRMK